LETFYRKGKTKFNKQTLNQTFQENPNMALLVYTFMTAVSKEEEVDFKSFELACIILKMIILICIVELLTHDPNKCQLKEHKDFEKIDILALATIGKFDLSLENLKTINVSYTQALDFVKVKFLPLFLN